MPPVRIEITVPETTYEKIEAVRGDVPRAAWIKRAIEERLSRKGCPTGKRIYGNERVAIRAVDRAAERGELPPMRHYECPECGHWHLSKIRAPANA